MLTPSLLPFPPQGKAEPVAGYVPTGMQRRRVMNSASTLSLVSGGSECLPLQISPSGGSLVSSPSGAGTDVQAFTLHSAQFNSSPRTGSVRMLTQSALTRQNQHQKIANTERPEWKGHPFRLLSGSNRSTALFANFCG
jgi:hypothetical protein